MPVVQSRIACPIKQTCTTANNLNQYTAVGAVTPTYDSNGNLTFDGTFTYCYDAENRLTKIIQGGTCTSPTTTIGSYAYDAQGRRKSKTAGANRTIYITDADNREVLEYNGSGAVQNWYSFALGPDDVLNQMNVAGGTRATLIVDIQGSIVGLLDSGGTLTKIGYRSYGENPSLSSGTYRYTARRFDAETQGSAAQPSGLYYYRARMYSPTLGRFMQVDPIGANGGINLYAYVGNDPLNLTDSSGQVQDAANAAGGPALAFAGNAAAYAETMGTMAGQGITAAAAVTATIIGAAIVPFTSTTLGMDDCGPPRCGNQYVVRGGENRVENFLNGTGVTVDSFGNLQGVSVQTAPNVSVQELSQRRWVPQNQIGVTTLLILQGAGATVTPNPSVLNPYHADLGGITAETASGIFRPTILNPNPKARN